MTGGATLEPDLCHIPHSAERPHLFNQDRVTQCDTTPQSLHPTVVRVSAFRFWTRFWSKVFRIGYLYDNAAQAYTRGLLNGFSYGPKLGPKSPQMAQMGRFSDLGA